VAEPVAAVRGSQVHEDWATRPATGLVFYSGHTVEVATLFPAGTSAEQRVHTSAFLSEGIASDLRLPARLRPDGMNPARLAGQARAWLREARYRDPFGVGRVVIRSFKIYFYAGPEGQGRPVATVDVLLGAGRRAGPR
jgi:hypothetical protein